MYNNLYSIKNIKDIMEKHGVFFNKTLGQNFITSPHICPKMVELSEINKDCGVLEIGTGVGVLTRELCRAAKKVVAIEIDSRLIPVLGESLVGLDNIHIINDNFLKVDIKKIIEIHFSDCKEFKVCANIPYYLTSDIITSFLEKNFGFSSLTFMVQKEVGERLCSKVGSKTSGAISFLINYFSIPKLLFKVSKSSFCPSPKVDSCVIYLDMKNKNKYICDDEKLLFKIVKFSFLQRRKSFANALSSKFNIEKNQIYEILKSFNIDKNIRGERLSIDQFIDITNKISAMNKS